jgi:hypothetical protein
MPDFEAVSMKEAKLRTSSNRQGKYLNEYVDYIQQLPTGQAGKLHPEENEKPATLPHSRSLSRNWVSKEYQRKSPRSWVSLPQKQRDECSRVDEEPSPGVGSCLGS